MLADRSFLQPHSAAAEARQHRMVVPRSHDDSPCVEDGVRTLLEKMPKLVVERFVHLVENQDLWVRFLRHRESEASLHALRVRQHRPFERVAERAARLDAGQGAPSGSARKAAEDAEEQRILAAGEQCQQARVDRQQRSDAPVHLDTPAVRCEDAREDPQQRRLAGAARPDQRRSDAALDGERYVAQPPRREACAAHACLPRRDDSKIPVEEELDTDVRCEDHQTTFANCRCSERYSGTKIASRIRAATKGKASSQNAGLVPSMNTSRYASNRPVRGFRRSKSCTSSLVSASGTSPGARKNSARTKLVTNARSSRSQTPSRTAAYAVAIASRRLTSRTSGNQKTFQVGATLYAAIIAMMSNRLEENATVSVNAAEIGRSIRLKAMLRRIGLRSSSAVIAFAIVNMTS